MRLWLTILENFQQAQQQSRAGFLNFGLQPEIRGAQIPVNEGLLKFWKLAFFYKYTPTLKSNSKNFLFYNKNWFKAFVLRLPCGPRPQGALDFKVGI